MMNTNNFSLDLAKTILDLELRKNNIMEGKRFNKMLCSCRNKMLKNYVKICQLMLVRFMAKLIKFLEDFDVDKSTVEDLYGWYIAECYDKMLIGTEMSPKMMLLTRLMLDRYDQKFFADFSEKFNEIVTNYQGESEDYFVLKFEETYEIIQDWMDSHILGLLSMKLNCANVSNQILEDYKYVFKVNSEQAKKLCKACDNLTCLSVDMYEHDGEIIHLYMTNESMNDGALCDFMDLVIKYHTNTKNIHVIVDFQLLEEDVKCDEYMYNRVKKILLNFKQIEIINFKRISFGEYLAFIEPYLSKYKG